MSSKKLKDLFQFKKGKCYVNWLDKHVEFTEFVDVIKNSVKSINIDNVNNLMKLYNEYITRFYEYSKKEVKEVNRNVYFFSITNCLGLETKSTSSIEYQRSLGWSDDEIKQRGKLKYSTNTIEYYLNKGYSLEESKKLFKERQDKSQEKGLALKRITGRYGQQTIEVYMDKGYSREDAETKMIEIGKKRSKGIIKWNQNNPDFYKDKTCTSIQYYLNKGYSQKEAEALRTERQRTFTLDKCIIKYGEEEGRRIHKERNVKWSAKVEAKYRNGEFSKNPKDPNSPRISSLSKLVIDKLRMTYPDAETYAHEFEIFSEKKRRIFAYDFK